MDSVSLEKATLYEKYRLPYAHEVIDELLAQIGPVEVVADIGSGTGQLARLFADRCDQIYAVEPDSSMRQVAREVLKVWPTVTVVNASAEQTTLGTDSIDLIVIGNAFHRFRSEACEEIRRVLRKMGWVALFSYSFANKSFTDMLFSKLATLDRHVARTEKAWHRTPIEMLFGNGATHTLSYPQVVKEGWEAFFGSACSGIEAPEREDSEFSQFEQINREVFEAFSVGDKIQIDYNTTVLLGQPRV